MTSHLRFFPIGDPNSSLPGAHVISADDGLAMVEAAPNHPRVNYRHARFHGEAIDALKSNPGHAGIQIEEGFNGHHHSPIIFSVDSEGKVLSGPGMIALENSHLCPPEC